MDRERAVLSWAVNDWANAAYATTVDTALLPPFFATAVAKGDRALGQAPSIPAASLWGYAVSLSATQVFLFTPAVNDASLPHVAPLAERDHVHAYALGSCGGGLGLLLSLGLILLRMHSGLDQQTAVRLSLALAALWWLGFGCVGFRRGVSGFGLLASGLAFPGVLFVLGQALPTPVRVERIHGEG